MSATNRGGQRKESDFYETPVAVIRDLLQNNHLEGDYKCILEPCCGSGNMVLALRETYKDAVIMASDLRDIRQIPYASVTYGNSDFLTEPNLSSPVDLVFTNPPYTVAEKIIRRSFQLYPDAVVVMLLRLDFQGSQDRYEFWRNYPVNELYPLACRPSFTGGGTDSNNYGWFVWRPGVTTQKVKVIWGRLE